MGIDRIGSKGPPALPLEQARGPSSVAETSRPFEVTKAGQSPKVGAVDVPTTSLDRLRSGEIDLNGYLDEKVNEATAHLVDLPGDQLEGIRGALRDRMASDPTLVDLVRVATGSSPQPPQDD